MKRHPFKDWLKKLPGVRPLRLMYRYVRILKQGFPDWARLIDGDRKAWRAAREDARSGGNILMATSVGAHLAINTLDSTLAAALTLRGQNVHVLLCDKDLPACMACEMSWFSGPSELVDRGPQGSVCKGCFSPAAKMFGELDLAVHRYGEGLSDMDRAEARKIASTFSFDEIKNYTEGGVNVGEHALAGALRFFARGSLDKEPSGEAVLRRFLEAAILTARATRTLLKKHDIRVVVAHHGIYVPQGIVAETARVAGVRVVTWNPAYRKQSFIFSHDSTYHHTLMTEPVSAWEDLELDANLQQRTKAYLSNRATGKDDWIWFYDQPAFDADAGLADLGVDPDKPCIGLLTNVAWDAQLHYRPNAFANMSEWILETIRYFEKRPDLQLLIRIHPAEITGALASREKSADVIAAAFPKLPDNVFVIPPENPISVYTLMPKFNAALIYGTKTGIELITQGVPVIVAGEAWIRGKGMTDDASSPETYFRFLDALPYAQRLDDAVVDRGLKYAFHFFFRRMIPLDFMEAREGWPPYAVAISSLSDLGPHKSRGLDVICNGIVDGAPFVYPAEQEVGDGTT